MINKGTNILKPKKMIKIWELRVGNCIYTIDEDFNKEVLKVDLNDMCNVECDADSFDPIPLSEEILLKCGFVEHPILNYMHLSLPNDDDEILPFFYADTNNGVNFTEVMNYSENFSIIKIRFLHQLQNIYFALTEKELTINL